VRHELESFLSANPDIVDPKCKIIDLYHAMWKKQSKVIQWNKESMRFFSKIQPKVYEMISWTSTEAERSNLIEDIQEHLKSAEKWRLVIQKDIGGILRRILKEVKQVSEGNDKVLHPDLTTENMIGFIDHLIVIATYTEHGLQELSKLGTDNIGMLEKVNYMAKEMSKKILPGAKK